ncbi:MAG TPA: toprim domain-containing protein [Stellaceae bacterium]|nr:toprim domain-containing protein [Stellaceae bacterium]
MVARVDGPNGELIAIHRTFLLPDGSDKAPLAEPKRSLGSWRGGAVRLAPAGPVLAIAEGIENALTVMVAEGTPAWSAVSKGGFRWLVPPADVRELLVVADNDANGHGQQAAWRAAERWAAAGWRVRLVQPRRPGEDVNDLLRKGGEGGCENMSAS